MPPNRMRTDKNDFSEIEKNASRFKVPGRGKSASLLLWFLNDVYRMDEIEAQDAVCDNQGDSGFDAIAVDEVHQEIVVFQSKMRERLPAMLGDVDLKTFVGSLAQLSTPESVDSLIKTTINIELRSLLKELDIIEKVKASYLIRAIFLTNVAANQDAINYIDQARRDGVILDVWDSNRLSPILLQLTRDWLCLKTIRSKLIQKECFRLNPMTDL